MSLASCLNDQPPQRKTQVDQIGGFIGGWKLGSHFWILGLLFSDKLNVVVSDP